MSRPRPVARLARLVGCWIGGGILFAAACSAGPPQGDGAGGEVVIGVDVPLTGSQAAQSEAVIAAVRREVAEGAFHGHVRGLTIRVAVFDHSVGGRRDPAAGERNLRQMIASPRLLGVIGPLNSDVAAGEIGLADLAHLSLISPAASHPCLTRPVPGCDGLTAEARPAGPNAFFRVVPNDEGQAAALVEFSRSNLRFIRVAVASDAQPIGRGQADLFESAGRHRGLNITNRRDLDPTSEQDVDGFLTAARSAGAEAVFFGGAQEGGACRVRGRMKGMFEATVPFLGTGGIDGAACLRDAGALNAGMYTAAAATGDLAGTARTAARVLLLAIERGVKGAGGNLPTREEVRVAVSQSGDPAFDARGDLRDQTFTVLRSDAAQGWVPTGQVTLPAG